VDAGPIETDGIAQGDANVQAGQDVGVISFAAGKKSGGCSSGKAAGTTAPLLLLGVLLLLALLRGREETI